MNGQSPLTPESLRLYKASYQGLCAKFISMMSPKRSIVENDGELMYMTLHAHFLPQQQYSRVCEVFLAFHALVYLSFTFFTGQRMYGADGASLLQKSVHNFRTLSATMP